MINNKTLKTLIFILSMILSFFISKYFLIFIDGFSNFLKLENDSTMNFVIRIFDLVFFTFPKLTFITIFVCSSIWIYILAIQYFKNSDE
jgi:hypothetical protein